MNNNKLKKLERIKYHAIREKNFSHAEAAIIEKVKKHLHGLQILNQSKGYLGIYWPLKNEVDLRFLKTNFKIPIALPSAQEGGQLTYHPWLESPLKKDLCGIPAPLDEPSLNEKDINLLLVPALAIDQNGYRLGYGGGFFDRLRSNKKWASIPSLVVLPKICTSQAPLPRDPWDIPFNGWINEEGSFKSNLKRFV